LPACFWNRIWQPPAECFAFSSAPLPPAMLHCPRTAWNRSRDSWPPVFLPPIFA
jgi:hypothetical protein